MWKNKARDGRGCYFIWRVREYISDVTKIHARNDGGLAQVVIKIINT